MAVSESQLEIPERDEKRGRIRLAPVRGNSPLLFQSAFASETVMYEYDCWADFERGQRSFGTDCWNPVACEWLKRSGGRKRYSCYLKDLTT